MPSDGVGIPVAWGISISAPWPLIVVVAFLFVVAASLPFLAAVPRWGPAAGSFYSGLHWTHRASSSHIRHKVVTALTQISRTGCLLLAFYISGNNRDTVTRCVGLLFCWNWPDQDKIWLSTGSVWRGVCGGASSHGQTSHQQPPTRDTHSHTILISRWWVFSFRFNDVSMSDVSIYLGQFDFMLPRKSHDISWW